jgi:type III secretion protein R
MQSAPVISDVFSLYILIALLGLLPLAVVMVTSYAKIVIILGLVRNALGVQQVPPNMVINGVALLLSAFIMAPVAMQAFENAGLKGDDATLNPKSVTATLDGGREPLRAFLDKHAGQREKAFFMNAARQIWPSACAETLKDSDLIVLAPSFILTELTEAFKIGFLLYMAFIIVDLIIANVLLALGLSQVTPTIISIPFKLLLFVAMDGWSALIHGTVLTYRS